MRTCLLCFLVALCASAQEYTPGPDSQVHDVPHGTVEQFTLPPGQFYPGTPHQYAVYTPSHAGSAPLPYMIFLDGSGYLDNGIRTPVVFDNLIAAKAIPPMIGIFVDPGVLPAIRPDAQNRYERVFEYDSLSNRYSQFLLTELLPAVAKQHPLSTDPNAHAIAGTSTGAVGAFVAAWHRPDQFRRVLSLIGTYVAMKGADTLPEIVRKTEAKPIRIWMQDGANDHLTPTEPYGTFYAGTWPRANQIMFDALQFSGYDAKLTLGTGGHDTKQGAAELPDALRWLWRDYAESGKIQPIVPHPPAALGDAGWMTRGSVWATVGAVGNWESTTGKMPGPASAVTFGSLGWDFKAVVQNADNPTRPSIALSPDRAMAVLTDSQHRHQWSVQLQADGSPANFEPFYRLEVLDDETGASGAAFDSLGQVYFATAMGVQVCEASGRVAMILNSPVVDKPVTSVAFGGPDRDWLYVIADEQLFRRKMKVHGVSPDKPEKPPQPPL